MTAAHRFEDRLLEQLRHVVVEHPAPDVVTHRRPRRTRLALAGAGVAAATAAVAIFATSSDVTTSAYAVVPTADGSVTVKIHSLSDATGLERSLRAAGVPAVVDYLPATRTGCVGPPAAATGGTSAGAADTTTHRTQPGAGFNTDGASGTDTGPSLSGPGPGPGATTSSVRIDGDGVTFTIDPGKIKQGDKVFITTSTGAISSIGMAITSDRSAAATCATNGPTP